MSELKLSPMRLLALKIAIKGNSFIVGPGSLSRAWLEKKGLYQRASSRDNFGNNSAAWHCLYSLKKAGYIQAIDSWGDTFKVTEKGIEAFEKQNQNG